MTSDPLGLLTPPLPSRRPRWRLPALIAAVILVATGIGYGVARLSSSPTPSANPTTPPATTAAAPTTRAVDRLPPALACTLAVPPALDLVDLVDHYKATKKLDPTAVLRVTTELSKVALLHPPVPLEKALVDLSSAGLEFGAHVADGDKTPFDFAPLSAARVAIASFCLPYASS